MSEDIPSAYWDGLPPQLCLHISWPLRKPGSGAVFHASRQGQAGQLMRVLC